MYPYDVAKAKALLAPAGKTGATLRLRLPTLPYATSCGQVVKSQLEQAGFKVTLDQLEFPAAWLTTVFKNADYDMSIVAHVEPRDMGAVFNPDVLHPLQRPHVRQGHRRGRPGHRAGAGRRHEEGGHGGCRRTPPPTGCSCCPTWSSRRRASPACRPTPSPSRSTCRTWPGPESRHDDPDAAMALRVLQRTLVLLVEPGRQLGAGLRLHGACCPATRRGSPWASTPPTRRWPTLRQRLRASTGSPVAQYAGWVGGLLRGDPGESYMSRAPIGPQVADRLQVTLCWSLAEHGHRAGRSRCRSAR